MVGDNCWWYGTTVVPGVTQVQQGGQGITKSNLDAISQQTQEKSPGESRQQGMEEWMVSLPAMDGLELLCVGDDR